MKYNLLTCTTLMCVEPDLNIRMVERKSPNLGTNPSRPECLCLAGHCLTAPLLSTCDKIFFSKKKKKCPCLAEYCLTAPLLSTCNKIIFFKKKRRKNVFVSQSIVWPPPSCQLAKNHFFKKRRKNVSVSPGIVWPPTSYQPTIKQLKEVAQVTIKAKLLFLLW